MQYTNDDVTAIILAGGLGRRMRSKNKGLITLQGKTLFQHVLDRIKCQTENILINANQDQEQYQLSGYSVVKDTFSGNQGPLAGILSCEKEIRTKLVLIIPCDAPLFPDNLLDKMLSAYTNNPPTKLCIAHDGDRLQNLFMLFHVDLYTHLNDFFINGNRKVGDWINTQQFTQVDFLQQQSLFININTEETLNSVAAQIAENTP